ncbi:MAG: hypothetical protein ACRD3D_18305 [Terriglobia bacterium]
MDEPYASRLKDLLRFRDLASAEASIYNLDAACRAYRDTGDREGINQVRALALKGKQRAAQMAANPRVNEAKRREKREIAAWFTVWLQTPEIFPDWLELRKKSEEFEKEFGPCSGDRSSLAL